MIINKRLSIGRYKQIMAVFAKHGFGFLLDQIGITRYLNIRKSSSSKYSGHLKLSTGERLRLSLEELGTTFIKLGQILSTRRDLFSPEIIAELTKLQHSVKSFPFPEVKSIIESEFADKLENIFVKFEQTPIASASISQVHCAKTVSGKNVAIKYVPSRPGDVKHSLADISLAAKVIGYKPLVTFKDGLEKAIDWYKHNL
jgi:ubiquinone biosynthesis protein